MAKTQVFEPKEKRPPTTEEQAKKYDTLIPKSFVEIDPATGKPKEESKLFFWGITHVFPTVIGFNSDEFRTTFQIQKYHRDQFTETAIDPTGRVAGMQKKHKPFVVFHADPNRAGEIKELGERMIDAEDFTNQFAIDDSVQAAEDLMKRASELGAQ